MDNYLINADQYLCSPQCPCIIPNTVPFTSNTTIAPAFNQWTLTNGNNGAVNFQGCSNAVKTNVYNAAAAASPAYFNPNGDFDAVNFWNYMANIENRFLCSGFCQRNYINGFTNQATSIQKYLFTDINRGPPVYSGCLHQVLNYVPSYLLAYGSIAIVLTFFQFMSLICAGILARHRKADYHNDVVVVKQKEVVVERPPVAYQTREIYADRPAAI